MEFFNLSINNFMSFSSQELSFPSSGLTLIEGINLDEGGSNGSGKSTIFDAISWCLFGKTVRGLKDDAVMNRAAKKDCRVSLGLACRGSKYQIERNRNDRERSNRFFYLKDDKLIELGTLAMTQEKLLQDLGIDFELFRCTVLFAQEETFNFVNASNKEQKEILSKVMKVDFEDYLEKAKGAYSQMESEMEDIKSKLMVLESHVDLNPEKVYQDEIDGWASDNEKEAENCRLTIKRYQSELAKIGEPKDIAKLKEMRGKIDSRVNELKAEWKKWCDAAAEARAEVRLIDQEAKKVKALVDGGVCPTCKQDVDGSHLHDDGSKNREKAAKKEDEANLMSGRLDDKISELSDKSQKIKEMVFEEEQKKDKLKMVGGYIREQQETLESIGLRENPWFKKREEHVQKQKKISEKIDGFKQQIETLEESIPYYKFWVGAFGDGGIKSFIFDLICSSLTSKANKFLNILTSGNVVISFDTQKKLKTGEYREKFDCVVTTNGERVPYESYSGGEKRKISLAVDMALATIMSEYAGSKFSMVVFDEQTNYMDKQGRENFMEMLKMVAKDRAAYIIDHDSEFKGLFDTVLTVEKRGGVSRIL